MLLRPQNVAIDDVENPTILHKLLETLGAEVVDFPFDTECCGSFNAVNNPDLALEASYNILNSALGNGADALALSCPLCDFNLGGRQEELKLRGFKGMPIIYFSQLMAVAFGLDKEVCRFDLNFGNPEAILKEKNLIS
jgi:heterodisulfide reductase subunit B